MHVGYVIIRNVNADSEGRKIKIDFGLGPINSAPFVIWAVTRCRNSAVYFIWINFHPQLATIASGFCQK